MSNSNFQIRVVTNKADSEIFLDVPSRVYKGDPNWVPPIRSGVAKQFAPENSFFQYGKLQQFIAVSPSNEPLGRIVAAVNHRLIEREGKDVGLFGYFECVEDYAIAQALLESARKWLQDQGMAVIRGPIDLSTHNNCLFLVDGFDSPPMILMPYNPRYYPEFMQLDGWNKAKDAYAYELPIGAGLSEEFTKAHTIACKSGVNFRLIRTKGAAFEEDCHSLYNLLNTAYSNNWSYTPRTEEEFLAEAKSLQSIVDPAAFPIAEYEGKMIGCFVGLPDYNMVLKHLGGKLDWLGTLKFIWYRRQINRGRVALVCALPEYRRKMVAAALIYLGMQGVLKEGKPYKDCELSWVYEDNYPSRKLIEACGAKIYKTYRIYEKAL